MVYFEDAVDGFLNISINANYPKYAESDVNRLARNDEDSPHSTLTLRKADRDLAVGTAQIDGVFKRCGTDIHKILTQSQVQAQVETVVVHGTRTRNRICNCISKQSCL